MPEKIDIIKDNGDKLVVEIISMFAIKIGDVNKEYILITANEIDQNGLIKIHVAQLLDNKLVKIVSDEEWASVKNAMRSIISSSAGDFSYITKKGPFNASDDFSRVIAVQDAAKSQMINDYMAKRPTISEIKKEEVVAPQVDDPINPNIFPKDNPNAAKLDEIVPGIMEEAVLDVASDTSNSIKPVINDEPIAIPSVDVGSVTNDTPAFEAQPVQNPINNNPVIDTPVMPVNNSVPSQNSLSQVIASEPANSNAKEILTQKIMAAVDEYIRNSSSSNSEIARLNKELEEKQAKIDEIMNLLK